MEEKEKNLNAILYSFVSRDPSLSYLSDLEKEEFKCFGVVTHPNLNVLHAFFMYFQANPRSNISLLAREENASIRLLQTKDSLLLFSDKEILSPSLFAKSMADLLYRFYIFSLSNKNSISMDSFSIQNMQVLISSKKDISSDQKSSSLNDFYLQIDYDENCQALCFKSMLENVDLYTLLNGMCSSYLEIALPISKIGAEKISRKYLVPLSKLEERIQFYKQFGDKNSLKIFEIKPIVLDEEKKSVDDDEKGAEEELIVDFREKRIDRNTTELIPLVEVDSFNYIIPNKDQVREIGLSMDDMLQRKIYLFMLKRIGHFSPMSYGFYNNIFFSKEIVIQIGSLIEEGLYYEQDNLVILPPVLDYFHALESRNKEDVFSLEYTKE